MAISRFVSVGRASGQHSTIVAFEPNPVMQKRLTRNIQLNELCNVTLYPVALGPQEAIMKLRFPPGRLGNYGGASLVMNAGKPAKGVEVEVKVLSPGLVAASGDYDYRVLKIDVEGHEEDVIAGAGRVLTENDCLLQIECFSATKLEQQMAALGYRLSTQHGHDLTFERSRVDNRVAT